MNAKRRPDPAGSAHHTDLRPMMSTDDVARFTRVSVSTLTKWRLTGGGPKYLRLGKRIVYRPVDVEAWLQARVHSSTSEYDTYANTL